MFFLVNGDNTRGISDSLQIYYIIDILTAFNDGRRILEEASQNSIVKLTRMLHMLIRTSHLQFL